MQAVPTAIPGLLILEPTVFGDQRGYFYESFNQRQFLQLTGSNLPFVQDNHSLSAQNVLRGLHYQIRQPQGKLVRVVAGEVYDVAVDLRQGSPTCGQWAAVTLSAENKRQFWIPPGFAHGFLVLSASAEFLYKTTDYWAPEFERTVAWDDPTLAIPWPLAGDPLVSAKDRLGVPFAAAELYPAESGF